jgi:hypothetical protein
VFFQVIDLLSLSADTITIHSKRHLIAAVLYIVTGGPQMLGAFPYEYKWLPILFQRELPTFINETRMIQQSSYNID